MDIAFNPKAVEIIDEYMNRDKPRSFSMERHCTSEFRDMLEDVFREKCIKRFVRLKKDKYIESEFDKKSDNYFHGYSAYNFTWYAGRKGYGYTYFLKAECELFFEKYARQILKVFINETYKSLENAILSTDCYVELCNQFEDWFHDRRKMFMNKMKADIQKNADIALQKPTKSHGGVANLLKVLTQTMQKQGSDIRSIAKMQYAICMQAGIFIPDEFLRDVAVTLDMGLQKEEVSE